MRGRNKVFWFIIWVLAVYPDHETVVGSPSVGALAADDEVPVVGELRRLEHENVRRVAFSADGRRILTGNGPDITGGRRGVPSDCQVRVWDLGTGKPIGDVPMPKGGAVVEFSPDSRQVLSISPSVEDPKKNFFQVWDLNTGQELRKFAPPDNKGFLALTQDWRGYLAVDPGSGTLQLWDAQSAAASRRFEGHTGSVEEVSFSRDGSRLLTGGHDQTVRLWDVASGKELRSFKGHQDRVNAVAISSDGRRGVSGGGNYNSPKGAADSSVRVWDLQSGAELRKFYEGEPSAVMRVTISPDGRRVLSLGNFSLDSPSDPTIRVWDVENGKQVCRLALKSPKGGELIFTDLTISPDGRHALTAHMDGMVRLWELPR